ncbi:MAG: oligopeptide ABC transporter ATP-binding protein OppD [Gammaproteobacteria bacterium]|nr:MAG: oligopeptide ABC transporter ATP-binding protein OppD [Gammaproteobacteria bacterium]
MRSIRATAEPQRERAVLQLEQLNVTFAVPQGEVAAVRDFSLTVEPGECVGIVGESGAGKSQVFLGALGLLAPNGRVRGRARFGSTDLIGRRSADLDRVRGAGIGMVFQDPMTSLTPHIAVGDQIAEPVVRHLGVSWREARRRALALLRRVHVTDAERRMQQYPHELSGGLRQRVMIAIALACEPALLIADEPTTALDVTIQAQILSLLAEFKRECGMALVLITHDLGAVAGVADRVAVMQSGRIIELDTVQAILKAPRHAYTQALLSAVPRLDDVLPARAAEDASSAAVALKLSRLSVHFAARRGWLGSRAVVRAVDGVSLELRAGEALGVVGESGSGKSTLARAALQLIRPTSGRVVWMQQALESLSARELKPLRRDLQIIFQDPLASLDPRMTIGAIVEEPLRVHCPRLDARGRAQAVAETLRQVGLAADMVGRYPHEFSGGECQRIGIARAMILEPRLLVCDEPVSALDVPIQRQIVALLADLKRRHGMSMLFVSHNLAVVRRLCERVLVLHLGRMMELAPAESLYTRPLHPYTRELLAAVPIADPDIQPGRLARAPVGEPPSPLAPPSGCVYRTRCPHAIDICRERLPPWDEVDGSRRVACHRWRELSDGAPQA